MTVLPNTPRAAHLPSRARARAYPPTQRSLALFKGWTGAPQKDDRGSLRPTAGLAALRKASGLDARGAGGREDRHHDSIVMRATIRLPVGALMARSAAHRLKMNGCIESSDSSSEAFKAW